MKRNHAAAHLTGLALLACFVGCAPGKAPGTAQSGVATPPASAPAAAPEEVLAPAEQAPSSRDVSADALGRSGLAGTSWRLVKIMSMDDTTYTPDDPGHYTLEFGPDGLVQVRADCNLGHGSWTSESPGALGFGPFAATSAECGPASIHARYMSEFQWVRSYVLKDGHLFLATMADGSIIEFEPVAPAP